LVFYVATMNVLVLALGFLPQYRVVRCAAAAGASVYVFGDEQAAWLAISRYCRKFILWAGEWDQVDASAIAALNDSIRRCSIDCVIPSDARTTRFLSLVRDVLECKSFPVPDTQAFDELNAKHTFAALCARLEIPHPSTRVLSGLPELIDLHTRDQLQFPVIAKPIAESGSRGVVRLDEDDFHRQVHGIDYAPILIQDFIPGNDLDISIYCEGGDTKTSLAYRRERGVFHFFENDRLDMLVRRLASALELNGVFNFDARATADGEIFLIECNPRFWYSLDYSMIAGINFVKLGLHADDSSQVIQNAITASVKAPSGLARTLLKPMSVRRADFSMLLFYLRDPLVCAHFQILFGIKWLKLRLGAPYGSVKFAWRFR
jgi:predicted ATP-grasp superfamily ATP-dependent carboligase